MSRPLTVGEVALAQTMFGDAVDYDRVRLTNRRWGRAAITFGSRITFPPSHPVPADFTRESPHQQAWLIHELTHVWQFQTATWRTLLSWLRTVLEGGYGPGMPGYRYRRPLGDWAGYNLEQQASMVEHAFLLGRTGFCRAAPFGVTLGELRACCPTAFPLAPDRNA